MTSPYYIGLPPSTSAFEVDLFAGDGSTTGFTLTRAPASKRSILVTIDGLCQHEAAYSISGTTLTFVAAPANGEAIEVLHLGTRIEIGQPAANTVGVSELQAGTVVQVVSNFITTTSSTSATFPNDDTIPQNTEGAEVVTCTITPKLATSNLHVSHTVMLSTTVSGSVGVGVFRDSTADAVYFSPEGIDGGHHTLTGGFVTPASSTSATTFKLRVGNTSAATVYWNGDASGRRYGGAVKSGFVITEIKA